MGKSFDGKRPGREEFEAELRTFRSAKDLLAGFVGSMHNISLSEEELQIRLELLILSSEFKGIPIRDRGMREPGFLFKNTSYEGLIDLLDVIPEYYIWFEKEDGKLTLNFCEISDNDLTKSIPSDNHSTRNGLRYL